MSSGRLSEVVLASLSVFFQFDFIHVHGRQPCPGVGLVGE